MDLDASFVGKVAIITGASSGIGAASAILFAKLGCNLSLTGRISEKLDETKHCCLKNGLKDSQVLLTIGDLTDENHLVNLVDKTVKHFGKLDILVNNAGIGKNGTALDSPIDDFDAIMKINVRSVIILSKLSVPHLIKTQGNIVNVSSINGICSFPAVTYYNISKAALDQFTKCFALELAPHRVRVNSVNPGVVLTNVHRRMGLSEEQYQNFLEHSKSTHALGRVADASEVARAILFLAKDATFTTGDLLRVDGGRGIMTPR